MTTEKKKGIQAPWKRANAGSRGSLEAERGQSVGCIGALKERRGYF